MVRKPVLTVLEPVVMPFQQLTSMDELLLDYSPTKTFIPQNKI